MPLYVVSTVNTIYKPGLSNGRAVNAQFRNPSAVCEFPMAVARRVSDAPPKDLQHAKSAVVVADTGNNVLRLVLLGSGSTGSNAGWWVGKFGPKTPSFMKPRGLCVLPDTLLVCDSGHHRIRSMALDGSTSLPFAGSGKKGHKDGPVESAQFNTPSFVCVCPSDQSIIVADTGNNALRRIFRGVVTKLAGCGAGSGEGSYGLVDGMSGLARFHKPKCVLCDREESLLVVDSCNHCVRVVSPDWTEVRTVAGGPKAGSVDGPVDKCQLNSPETGCLMPDGTILVADRDNNKIRWLGSKMEAVGTLAGTGEWGAADGFADESMCVSVSFFSFPMPVSCQGRCLSRP